MANIHIQHQQTGMSQQKRDDDATGNKTHLDMRRNQPIWNLAMHCNKRYVNESLSGYVYKPKPSVTKLPTLRQNRSNIADGRATKRTYQMSRSVDSYMSRSPDSLPPLKFHASVSSYPFSKKPPCTPKWAFQDKDISSPRFQNETFRIFRPMLYSVLLTRQLLPHIRNSNSQNTSRQNSDHSDKS